MTDVGQQTIDWLYGEQLQVDDEWAVRGPTGFTWWAYSNAQTIEIVGEEVGPDGRIYAAACCEHLSGGIVHILRYNDATDSLDHVLNVAEAVGEPADSGRATQCKIHYGFAASAEDGILYAATHMSAPGYGRKAYRPWGDWKTDGAFPCSYVVAYDTRRDAVAWTSPFIPREGCRCLA